MQTEGLWSLQMKYAKNTVVSIFGDNGIPHNTEQEEQ